MIRINLQIELRYRIESGGADFIVNSHAARAGMPGGTGPKQDDARGVTGRRFLRLQGTPQEINLTYSAAIDAASGFDDPVRLAELPVDRIPVALIECLYPPSGSGAAPTGTLHERLASGGFFPDPEDAGRVQRIRDWLAIDAAGSGPPSDRGACGEPRTPASVSHEFAHLMALLARAVCLPASSGSDSPGAAPVHPVDRPVLEIHLGQHWYPFDAERTPIRTGSATSGTGRDASGVTFATAFGRFRAPRDPAGSTGGAARVDAPGVLFERGIV